MPSKYKINYVCSTCGYITPRWSGKCPECGQWNTLSESLSETSRVKVIKKAASLQNKNPIIKLTQIKGNEESRIKTCITEFDRVLGGGITTGSVILIGGDPGIGKSTLMLQIANNLSSKKLLYVCGEESPQQIKMRCERLGYNLDNFLVFSETSVDDIAAAVSKENPDIVVIDSIQTVSLSEIDSSPGTVTQIRESASALMKIAKSSGIPFLIVGHITKDGAIAGPKIIEHMVDVVLHFEGERTHLYRILRSIKNRFGSTNEIGIFEMTEKGLKEVLNPSEVFLSQRNYGASGCVISSSIEGTRPILIEVQALVTSSNYGVPQRTSMGFDYKKLNIITAVLEKRMGLFLNKHDIFINIAGGIKIDEPAIDLAVAISLYSSFKDIPVDSETVVLGEVGLAGEIRGISSVDRRINESSKLGFKHIILPSNNFRNLSGKEFGIKITSVEKLKDAVSVLF